MRAIVFATGECAALGSLTDRTPAPLLPLMDRPFLQHVVEVLVERGVTEFDVVLSHLPEKIEAFLGDGARWGSRIRYHLAREAGRPHGLLRVVDLPPGEETVWLAHADRLPRLPAARGGVGPEACVVTVATPEGPERGGWTGWAALPASSLAALASAPDERALAERVQALGGGVARVVPVEGLLSVRSFAEILAAHRLVLDGAHPGLQLTGREVEAGVWLSRNVSLHPTARIVPPAYVGQDCQIGAGAVLGPHAVVGHGCLVDEGSTVQASVVFPGSYVGKGLELAEVLVDKNRLVSVAAGAALPVSDAFILGRLAGHEGGWRAAGVASWALSLAALAVLWPLLVVVGLGCVVRGAGPALARRPGVRLPAAAEEEAWRSYRLASCCGEDHPTWARGRWHAFAHHLLPGLLNVLAGDLQLVGVPPRSPEAVRALPPDWRALYLHSKGGLIGEADAYAPAGPSEDERYSAEAFYAARAGLRHDAAILAAWVRRLCLGLPRRDDPDPERDADGR